MRVSESIIFLAAIVVAQSPKVIDASNVFDDGAVKTEVVDNATELFNEVSAGLVTVMNEVDANTVKTKESAIGMATINMLDNKIICGYQGWYSFPGDGSPPKRLFALIGEPFKCKSTTLSVTSNRFASVP
jgi:hypothetical protein